MDPLIQGLGVLLIAVVVVLIGPAWFFFSMGLRLLSRPGARGSIRKDVGALLVLPPIGILAWTIATSCLGVSGSLDAMGLKYGWCGVALLAQIAVSVAFVWMSPGRCLETTLISLGALFASIGVVIGAVATTE